MSEQGSPRYVVNIRRFLHVGYLEKAACVAAQTIGRGGQRAAGPRIGTCEVKKRFDMFRFDTTWYARTGRSHIHIALGKKSTVKFRQQNVPYHVHQTRRTVVYEHAWCMALDKSNFDRSPPFNSSPHTSAAGHTGSSPRWCSRQATAMEGTPPNTSSLCVPCIEQQTNSSAVWRFFLLAPCLTRTSVTTEVGSRHSLRIVSA